MIKEHLKTTFFDKIKQNANIAIFGSGIVGRGILNDIKKYRPDVKVKCFIDTYNTGNVEGIDILPFSRVDELKDIDLVVSSTRRDYSLVMNIFQYYGINFLPEERFIEYHYRNPHSPLTDENLDKILDIFNDEADKELFRLIFSSRICRGGWISNEVRNHRTKLKDKKKGRICGPFCCVMSFSQISRYSYQTTRGMEIEQAWPTSRRGSRRLFSTRISWFPTFTM